MDISALYKCFTECGKVTTDSRNCPEGSMFIALKGETFNGNAYALQALEKGCQFVGKCFTGRTQGVNFPFHVGFDPNRRAAMFWQNATLNLRHCSS